VLDSIKLPKPKTFTQSNCNDKTRAQDEPFEIAKRGLAAWLSVKQWEIVHGRNLETAGATRGTSVCVGRSPQPRTCVNASEARGWVVDGRNVFDRPPHFTGHNSRHYYGQDIVTGVAETNSWYHLNMLLDPGYRVAMPSHFAYVYSHIEILQAESNIKQGFRFWASMIKQRQLQTNGVYGQEAGLDLRTAQPYIFYSARDGSTATQASVGKYWTPLVQAALEDFVADASNGTAAEWDRASGNSDVQDETSTNFTRCDSCFAPGGEKPFDLDALQGRNAYRAIPKLRSIGVSAAVLSSLIDWCEKTWPRGDWDALR
jgi:hypothetical protein